MIPPARPPVPQPGRNAVAPRLLPRLPFGRRWLGLKQGSRLLVFLVLVLNITPPPQAHASGELLDSGRTYLQAQTLRWVDGERFAVGRWDGSITLFRRPAYPRESGPVLLQSLASGSGREVGKVDVLPSGDLLTSDSADRLSIWAPEGEGFRHSHDAVYDAAAGMLNSGCLVEDRGRLTYVSGHENGRVIFWPVNARGPLRPLAPIDVRSPDPIRSPYPIKNVRGVVPWREGIVVTGAEDGDLCLVSVRIRTIFHRQRYNPAAQRGINGLALLGDLLLVSNCTVGTGEPNLWLFRVTTSGFTLLDSKYLATAPDVPDIFSVSLALTKIGDELHFYATTGEGILWHGRIENDRLLPLDSVTTGHPGVAPVLDILPGASFLATADHDVRVFQPRNGGGTTRRIAVVHAFPGLGEVRANRLLLEKAIRRAAAAGARWIVTPELSESGYKFVSTIGTDWIEPFPGPWVEELGKLAGRLHVSLFVGLPEREAGSGTLHNSVAVLDGGGALLGTYRKINVLPTPSESWAVPGTQTPVFTIDGTRIGILVCADAYGPEIAREYARLGVDLLLSSAAWAPGSMGPNGVWEARSRETGLPLVVCNRTGAEPGLSWLKAESVVDFVGRRLFTFQSPETRVFLVDWDRQKMTFTGAGSFKIE